MTYKNLPNEPHRDITSTAMSNCALSPRKLHSLKGDYVVPVNQKSKKYILTMLEPQSESGFFAWNFFDLFLEGQDCTLYGDSRVI